MANAMIATCPLPGYDVCFWLSIEPVAGLVILCCWALAVDNVCVLLGLGVPVDFTGENS